MIKILIILLSTIANYAGALTPRDIDYFQPPIIVTEMPTTFLNPQADPSWFTTRRGLNEFKSQVPTFNQKGNLLASWTPNTTSVKNRPTFIILHGGHGIGGHDINQAMVLRDMLHANVLVLDSFWSRGRQENWLTFTEFGADMRALDSIAAARFVISQGVDPRSIYLIGGSQGGWAVLRLMTNNPFYNQYNKLFAAGIALYPVCITGGKHGRWHAPPLGPYNNTVVIFSAGNDMATPISQCDRDIFTSAIFWKHYPNSTHGFDVPFFSREDRNIDGTCTRAMNVYNRFPICRDDSATKDMFNKIHTLVTMLTPY